MDLPGGHLPAFSRGSIANPDLTAGTSHPALDETAVRLKKIGAAEHWCIRIQIDYALRLLEQGYICLPLRAGGKHLDLAAMEYRPSQA